MIVSTGKNLASNDSIQLGNIKFSSQIKNKVSLKKKKSFHKKLIIQNQESEIKSEGKSSSDRKRFLTRSEMQEEKSP